MPWKIPMTPERPVQVSIQSKQGGVETMGWEYSDPQIFCLPRCFNYHSYLYIWRIPAGAVPVTHRKVLNGLRTSGKSGVVINSRCSESIILL